MADPRPVVDTLLTEGLGADAFYDDDQGLTVGQFNQRLDFATRHLEALIEQGRAEQRLLPVDVVEFENLDGSGNATFQVYQVGAGLLLEISYFVVEVATFDVTNARTPANAFSSATFWMGFFSSPNQKDCAQGGMIDFLPTVDNAQGIPAVLPVQGGGYFPPRLVRSQQNIVCKVVSGPASQRMSVRMGGWLRQNG